MIKLFGKPKNPENKEKTVLFVCVENSGRSQMAEGLFRKYAPRGYTALSAGTKPSGQINPLAIQAMKEYGIDASKKIQDSHRGYDKKCYCECKYGMHG
jgi:arsenate reductase